MQTSAIRAGSWHRALWLLALLAWTLSAAGQSADSKPETKAEANAGSPLPPHHRSGGFQNNYLDFAPRGLADLMRWRWRSAREGLPPVPSTPTPRVEPDLAFISSNAGAGAAMQPAVTWIGHATVLAQLGGLNLLTDPIFSQRASPVSFAGPVRAHPPGLTLAQLPRIDLVVISHNHYDHCDAPSLQALNEQPGGPPLFLVPLGMKRWMSEIGVDNTIEMDWWQSHRIGEVEVVMTPVQHWSGRSLSDRMNTLWGGWAVFAPDAHLFFAGDTGYSPDFSDIARRFAARQGARGFDIALIPVGAYEPRWFMKEQHVDPDEAVRMHRDLRAQRSLGIHWGTFELTDEALDEPPRALARALARAEVSSDQFFLLALGQTRQLPRRDAAQ
jgi:N-acyl-phosphatidylethanolamine-hydrolysing phospholipase D